MNTMALKHKRSSLNQVVERDMVAHILYKQLPILDCRHPLISSNQILGVINAQERHEANQGLLNLLLSQYVSVFTSIDHLKQVIH
jgi:hypothetical protein